MIELLRDRRSIRKYTDKSIDPEKIELLKYIASVGIGHFLNLN